jgi:hypothetical protein
VIYLGFCAVNAIVFLSCSYMVHHYVDLEAVDTRMEEPLPSAEIDTERLGETHEESI